MKKRYGSNYERELQRKLWDNGFVCIRVAGSGSSTYPAPDLIVIKNGKTSIIEVKSTKNNIIYLDYNQIRQLKIIGSEGVNVFIAVKFVGRSWYFIKLEDLGESNKIDYNEISKNGYTFEDFMRLLNKIHK